MQATIDAEAIREAVIVGSRALVGVAARSLAEVGEEVSLSQYRVLVLIDGRGPQTMGDLADSLGVNRSTVTRVCDVLVHKRLIRRVSSSTNRRTVSATLTGRGRQIVEQVMERRRHLIGEALTRMGSDAQRSLARGLSEFAAAADEVSGDAWTLGWPIQEESGRDGI